MFRVLTSSTRLARCRVGGATTGVARSVQWSNNSRHFSDLSKYGNVLGGENMDPRARATFEAWHNAVDEAMRGDTPSEATKTAMRDRVDKKCKFYPPTYHTAWEGRDEFLLLIECVSEVFGKSFTYGRQWISPDGRDWVLEFNTNIGDTKRRMTGVDMVKLNEEGKIEEFIVLARPPNAVAELKSAMMQKVPMRLAKLKAKQSLGNLFS